MARRFVLSIDGGGVRGIVAAIALSALQQERQRLGKKAPLADCFDLIAGTSTGAIIAAGLNASKINAVKTDQPPLSIDDISDLFRDRSREIFPPSLLKKIPVLGRLPQLFGPLHDPAALQSILEEMLGDVTFQEIPNNTLIPAYSIDPRTTLFMRGGPDYSKKGMDDRYGGIRLVDGILGSAAAPTFFPPHQIINMENGLQWTAVDGAVYLNDPALTAYSEALRLFPNDEIYVLSLGTGRETKNYPFEQARRWGFADWVAPLKKIPLISAVFDGQARAVNQQLHYMLGERYVRLDYTLSEGRGSDQIDDSSKKNIRRLINGAEEMVAENQKLISDFAQLMI